MLKNIAKLECKIGERVYQFLCDNDSPLPELKEAFFQFQKFVGQIEDQAEILRKKQEEEKNQEQINDESYIKID